MHPCLVRLNNFKAQLRPPLPSPYLSLEGPLTRKRIDIIRNLLRYAAARPMRSDQPEPTAAVLLPLCNVNGKGGILFEVRGKLRHHSGEVSFPGGKIDEEDGGGKFAALRETWEEIGVRPPQVEILAAMDIWREKSLNGLGVTPYVGFLSDAKWCEEPYNMPTDTPLPEITLSSLQLSGREVASVFHLPFDELITMRRLRAHLFRDLQPYWAVDVSDRVDTAVETAPEVADEVGGGREGRLEIWGLTGWYLSLFMRVMGTW